MGKRAGRIAVAIFWLLLIGVPLLYYGTWFALMRCIGIAPYWPSFLSAC
jgi:hypothetical protein